MSVRKKVEDSLEANKFHQAEVKAYIERLQAELADVDDMLETANIDQEQGQPSSEFGTIDIPGATKPTSLILQSALLSEESPFYADARWRETYEELTTVNPMKVKEQDALRGAIRSENHRLLVLKAQSQGLQPPTHPEELYEQNVEGLDWKRIAIKVSELVQSVSRRRPEECEVRWLGYLHPDINRASWLKKELADLKELVIAFEEDSDDGQIDWTEIAKKLGTGRSPIDCMSRGMTRKAHTWDAESDRKLLESVRLYGDDNWGLIAMTVSEDATIHQCQKRYYDTLDPNLKRGAWSEIEDAMLLRAVAAYSSPGSGSSGTPTISWQDVATFIPGRTNNQCREHYQAKMKVKPAARAPTVTGNEDAHAWAPEEDARLLEATATLPAGEWEAVSEKVGGDKTGEKCRKRYEVLQKRESSTAGQQTDTEGPPAKRQRKARTAKPAKPRGKKVKDTQDGEDTLELLIEPPESIGPVVADESTKIQPSKKRVRPKPRASAATEDSLNDLGEGENANEPEGHALVTDEQPPREDAQTTLQEEGGSRAKATKPSRMSAKAKGKQKATTQLVDNEGVDGAVKPKKKRGRPPKVKAVVVEDEDEGKSELSELSSMSDEPESPGAVGDATDRRAETTISPMEVDDLEQPNKRRSTRLKSSTKGK